MHNHRSHEIESSILEATSYAAFQKPPEEYTLSVKPEKALKSGSRKNCKAKTKAGAPCQAPAVEKGLCFCHAYPEKLAELGRRGGQKNRRWNRAASDLPHRSLKSIGEVSELLEETINRVRQGPFDLRSANSIGFLASTLLKAPDQRLEDRVAQLEAVLCSKGETSSETFEFLL
jgi:hypothetical protein